MEKVKIHVIDNKTSTEFLQKRFNAEGIAFEIVQDRPIKNRPYPYCTFKEEVLCNKRVILRHRSGDLK